jgi:outer membrane protein OmpA-like peptidoglycan-associated protein
VRRSLTAFIWIVVIALGTGASEYYKTFRHPEKIEEWVQEYETDWKAALDAVATNPPVHIDEFLKTKHVPFGQHKQLRELCEPIERQNQPQYDAKVVTLFDDLEREFDGKWEDAIENGTDTPAVDTQVKTVHAYHQDKLRERLKSFDETMTNKHPRIKLALDSFSGYSVFRSREFLSKLSKQNIKLHLVDDDAVYKKRIETLQKGETPLAVFTIDALINNSAQLKDAEPPGKIVLVIDESLGADAMIGYENLPGDYNELKAGVKIVYTKDSPSETLARLVRTLKPELRDSLVAKNSIDEVYDFAKTNPKEPQAFILWEPYVTRLMKERSKAHVLIDSEKPKARGYIVDVLVVQKKFLEEHKDKVEPIVRAYLEALNIHRQKGKAGMVDLVLADSEKMVKAGKLKDALTKDEAESIVGKIDWRSFAANCAHFGLTAPSTGPQFESMKAMVNKINDMLVKTRAIGKKWDHEESFFDPEICKALQDAKFPTEEPPVLQIVDLKLDPLTFPRARDAITEDIELTLMKVAVLMKENPAYTLEIRAHKFSDAEADVDLAKKRADTVSRYLRDTGSVAADRVKIAIAPQSPENPRAGATIVVYQPAG